MPEKVDLEVGLPCANVAPLLGRWALKTFISDRVAPSVLTGAELLVSELVTNALLHSRQHITVRASLDTTRLLVQVSDQRTELAAPRHRAAVDPLGELGLALVQHISSRWGVNDSTTAWFELELPVIGATST